jgi:hypothetical protein
MSGWRAEWESDPAFIAEMAKLQRRHELAARLTSWMLHIPVLGKYTRDFWFCIIDEGFRATLKPRWGAITFAYLNDGCGATVWHTWRQITHDQDDPYTGIYCMGAPHSLKEAEAWEAKWAAAREKLKEEAW